METQLTATSLQQNPPTVQEDNYRVWACDNQVYGPVTFGTVTEWVADGRILPNTWLYRNGTKEWQIANRYSELKEHFLTAGAPMGHADANLDASKVTIEELRQFPILSGLSATQLNRLVTFAHLELAEADQLVIKRNAPGDCFYFILAGSVRARIRVGGEERTLAYIQAGQFFGDLAMLTQTPRSADVVAMQPTKLLGLNGDAFRRLIQESPETAAPLLFGMACDLAHHILEDNVRFQRELASDFIWR